MAQPAPPFTALVIDDASHAGGFAFDEAARMVARIPHGALHAIYLVPWHTSMAEMLEVAPALRADTTGRAAALGIVDRLMGVHVRASTSTSEIVALARELHVDLVIVPAYTMRGLLRRSQVEELRMSLTCPVVTAGREAPRAPDIEPPCPKCVVTRTQSRGRTWWCPTHATDHVVAHRYSYRNEHAFAEHDSEFIPTGVSFR